MDKRLSHFYFKGIKISDIDMPGLRNLIEAVLAERRWAYFCLTDVGNLMMAQEDHRLASAINNSTLSLADGTPLAWYGKLIGRRTIRRISGIDLFQQLLHHTNYRHFILGDTVDTFNKVKSKARTVKPDIQITGYSPPFKSSFSKADNDIMLEKIAIAQPNIIWVSFGGGKQEKWMLQNASKINGTVVIGVGAALKFYTGELSISPKIIQRLGLQWTTRLRRNPKRWLTKGQFKYRLLFLLNFPLEYIRQKTLDNRRLSKAEDAISGHR